MKQHFNLFPAAIDTGSGAIRMDIAPAPAHSLCPPRQRKDPRSEPAAILRVANALDRHHPQSPIHLKIVRDRDRIVLLLPNLSDPTMTKLPPAGRQL